LPPDIEASLYRIIQEAMNNIARHSGASACAVMINTVGQELRLVVEDNGCGLKASQGHGLGLIAMRERAQAQAGSFAIDSVPSGGTCVVVTMKVAARDSVAVNEAGAV
jgi:signal transduction histidine kinase